MRLVGRGEVAAQHGDFALVAALAARVSETSERMWGGSIFEVGRGVVVTVWEGFSSTSILVRQPCQLCETRVHYVLFLDFLTFTFMHLSERVSASTSKP